MNVAKVDRDVAYVAIVVHICCKLLFPTFLLFFHTYVASVFIWILHMFHTYVAIVLSGCWCFLSVSDACFKYFIYLRTYIASVASGYLKSRSDVTSPSSPSAISPRCLFLAFYCLASFSDCGGGAGGWRRGRGRERRAHALPFYSAGRNRLPLDSSWWVRIPLPLLVQAHVSSHGWLVGAASEHAVGAGRLGASHPHKKKSRPPSNHKNNMIK
jgi:hypothetical protein